jgi:hypothetical protein
MPASTERTPHIRTSERVLFKRCQQAWWWAYREGLKPRAGASDALWFGELMHIALANWYVGPGTRRGPEPAETFKALSDDTLRYIKTEDADEEKAAKYTDLQEMGIVLMEEYVAKYGRDERMLMIQPEKTFHIDIPFPAWFSDATRKVLVEYDGTTDGVYRDADSGLVWLLENKSAKTVRKDHLTLDEQAGSYWALVMRSLLNEGLVKPNEQLKGIMYNFVRKGLPDPRPRDEQGYCLNKDGSRSKVQPSPLFVRHPVRRTKKERASQLKRIQNDAAVMELYRTGELPLSKTPHWSCSKLCEFFHMCELQDASGNWQDYRKLMYVQKDPYADHRKTTEESVSFEF